MASATRRSGNLPAETTSFVGRRRELAELRTKLSASRIVSLVGPGGVGKTRLAVRAASDLARGFQDGAWLVELAEVRDPAVVTNAAATSLGLRDQDPAGTLALLLSFLAGKELLLVVDNCEHVLEHAARLVTAILEAAPGVRVITTTREPLSVPGEHVLPVPPLDLPPAGDAEPLHQLRQNEAIVLFAQRAAAAAGRFELTAGNRAAVVGLCRRLDGLPLAIELAAVRTRVLSVHQILARLDDRFALLTSGSRAALPRHQTLRTTIDWSHDLLAADERSLLRRLSVFAGRFTLDDAEGVCASDDLHAERVLHLLSSLVDKSLVTKEDARALACYRLPETMREYAGLKLREADEEDPVARRCIQYYVSWCHREAEQARYRLVDWLEWLDLEIDNIRFVLLRSLSQADYDSALDLVGSLAWYWITRATTEGVRRLDQLLAASPGDSALHAGAHFMRGFLAVMQADPATARPELEHAVAMARNRGELRLLAESLSMASVAANMAGDHGSAQQLFEDAHTVAASLDDLPATLACLQAQAMNSFFTADLDTFRSASAEGIRLSRAAGDLYTLEIWLMNQGFADLTGGGGSDPAPLLTEALQIADRVDDRIAQFYLLGALACHAEASGEPGLATQLFGASESLRAETGASVNAILAPLLARATQSARAALGVAAYQAQFTAGAMASRDAALRLALGKPAKHGVQASHEGPPSPLAKREGEVASLVSEGLTNKQIGTRLFISERTVENCRRRSNMRPIRRSKTRPPVRGSSVPCLGF